MIIFELLYNIYNYNLRREFDIIMDNNNCTLVTIYRKIHFNIYSAGNRFIVHNTRMEFSKGHTHIRNFSTAKFIIELSLHKSIPKHLSNYLLISLIRINDDIEYINKLKIMLHEQDLSKRKGTSYKSNKPRYMNKRKNIRRKEIEI